MTRDNAIRIIRQTVSKLPGWCDLEKAERLFELASGDLPDRTLVELGVFGGRSFLPLALGCSLYEGKPGRHVYGIDPYKLSAALEGEHYPGQVEWWTAVDFEGTLQGVVDLIERESLGPFATLCRHRSLPATLLPGPVAVLHQDGNHSEDVSLEEAKQYLPLMAPRGYWVIDDTNWASLRMAQYYLLENGMRCIENHETWTIFQNGPHE